MEKEKVWNLFKLTGDIKYYMLYKEMEKLNEESKSEDERNNTV